VALICSATDSGEAPSATSMAMTDGRICSASGLRVNLAYS
jgi:hypothetical protein